eukprot:5388207-Pleurochrysis_carterae.AAC.3
MPGETSRVVYFCVSAPRAHCGKVINVAWWSVFRARTVGIIHRGAWRLCMKMGKSTAPRSAGCSRTYSAPESRAARRRRTVLLTSSFASWSSRACCSGTSGSPITWSRLRTGGGPPSATDGAEKKRETEKVEQGGEAITADCARPHHRHEGRCQSSPRGTRSGRGTLRCHRVYIRVPRIKGVRAGRLRRITIGGLSERVRSVRLGSPRERGLVEVYVGCGHHFAGGGYPYIVCTRRSPAAPQVHAYPGTCLHASFGVRGAGLHRERVATEGQDTHDSRLLAYKQLVRERIGVRRPGSSVEYVYGLQRSVIPETSATAAGHERRSRQLHD